MGQQPTSQNLCQNSNASTHKGANDLVFYLTVHDQQFGTVPVYTSTKKPSSYVAKIQKNVDNSKIYNIFQQIQNAQLSSLASLHAFQITRQKYCTGHIQQKITAYWEYYNYSFQDFLKMRFFKRIPFSEDEIWLIIKSCCQSYSLFHFHNLVLDLDLKHIMVIPQGKLKIYWHQIEAGNNHLKFYQRLKSTFVRRKTLQSDLGNRQFRILEQNQSDYFFFSPQQIQAIQKKQETMKIDFTRVNSFRLGMIILYCITLTNPIKTCYGINNTTGQRKIKIMVLNSLYESKIQNSSKYSDDLKHLIKLLLLEDPNKRIPIDCLQNIYEKFMSDDTQLAIGMNQNQLYAPSSQRDYKKEVQKNNFQNSKAFFSKNEQKKISYHQKNESKFNNEKVIIQSRVKSIEPEIENQNANMQSHSSNGQQIFDKFDTKTIKISSNYNRR